MTPSIKKCIASSVLAVLLPVNIAIAQSNEELDRANVHNQILSEHDLNHRRSDSLNAVFQEQREQQSQLLRQEPTQLQQISDPRNTAHMQAQITRCENTLNTAITQLAAQPTSRPGGSDQAAPTPPADAAAVSPAVTTCPTPGADVLPMRNKPFRKLRYNIRKWWSQARITLTVSQRAKQEALQARATGLRCAVVNCARLGDQNCAGQAYVDLEEVIEDYQQAASRNRDPAAADRADAFAECALTIDFSLVNLVPVGTLQPSPGAGTVFTAPPLPPGSHDIFGAPTRPSTTSAPIQSAAPSLNQGGYGGGVLFDLVYPESFGEYDSPSPQPTP